jgi:hypothetical protein
MHSWITVIYHTVLQQGFGVLFLLKVMGYIVCWFLHFKWTVNVPFQSRLLDSWENTVDLFLRFFISCFLLNIQYNPSSLADDIKTCAPTSNSLSQEAHKILIDQQFPGIDILKIYNYSLCSSRGCSSFSAASVDGWPTKELQTLWQSWNLFHL